MLLLPLRRAVLCPAELLARVQFLFVSVTPVVENPPNVRRRTLYPGEVRGHIHKLFSYTRLRDSNGSIVRRAVLCPAELLARMQFLFVSVTPAGERPPNARRRPLHPTGLRGLIQGSFCLTGFDQAVFPACLVVYRAGPAGQGGSRSLLLHHYRRRRIPCQPENHAPHSGFPARTSR